MSESTKKIINGPKLAYHATKSLGCILFDRMTENGNLIAQIDAINNKKQTYKEFLTRCIRAAIVMRSKGIKQNDIVTVCSTNHIDTFVPYLATLFLGATVSAFDPHLSKQDIMALLNQTRPKMIFVSTDAVKAIEGIVEEEKMDTEIAVFGMSFDDFLTPSPEEENFQPVEVKNLKDTAMIIFSSGSSGLPKGICLNHFGLLGCHYSPLNPTTGLVFLGYSSVHWMSATILLLKSIFLQATRLVVSKFDPNDIWDLIKTNKVNVIALSVYQWLAMCKNGRPEKADTSSLLYGTLGGAYISKEQISHIKSVLPNTLILNCYGLTELNGLNLGLNPIENPTDMKVALENPESLGRAMEGFTYKVVDVETEEILGPNQIGELRVKSDLQMNGYYNVDSINVWNSEGYLKTGDIVYYKEDLSFYYVERMKEMLKYRSFQIAPVKLEMILMKHPAVKTAAVVGLPHPEDGDHPVAIIELQESVNDEGVKEDIMKYFEEMVEDREKLRGGLKIVDALPMTPSDKIDRKRLKKLAINGLI